MDEHSTASWDATLDGILLGAKQSPAPVLVASTLPDLLPEDTVQRCLDAGVPAVWGLTTGLKVANALRTPHGRSGATALHRRTGHRVRTGRVAVRA